MSTALKSATERIKESDRIEAALTDSSPRYFVQFAWDQYDTGTNAIPGRFMLRGDITPCTNYRAVKFLPEIPDGQLIPGTESLDREGKQVYGKVLQYARPDAESLALNEASADIEHKQGIYEITTLAGLPVSDFARIEIVRVFYPNGLESLPARHGEVIAYLQAQRSAIDSRLPENLPASLRDIVHQVLNELIQAAEYANTIQKQRLEYTHRCFNVPPSDPSGLYKKSYDLKDEEMLKRTGLPRHNEAQQTTAKALELLAMDKTRDTKPADPVINLMQQQIEMMREQMENQQKQNAEQAEILKQQVNQQNTLIQSLLAQNSPRPQSQTPQPRRP